MTVEQWLATRTPRPPAPLAERIAMRLGSEVSADATHAADACAEAAVRLVKHLLSGDCGDRHNALDLLAADALITYAIESTAEQSRAPGPEMEELVSRLSAIAAGERS